MLPTSLRYQFSGKVLECIGPVIKASLPGAAIGDQIEIRSVGETRLGVVTGFNQNSVSVVCIEGSGGIRVGSRVTLLPRTLSIYVPENPVGLALSASGQVIDGRPTAGKWSINLQEKRTQLSYRCSKFERFNVGIPSIDSLFPISRGQRLLVCAEPGVGKTHLLKSLSENSEADIIVFALIGERGREAKEFITNKLTPEVRERSVIIISTSDDPPLKRVISAELATSLSEQLAKGGKKVLLLFDSLTRYVRAKRDLALSSGEQPIRRGYPASIFSDLPKLLERPGNFQKGSITAFYTMLLNSELDEDPMLEEAKGILDGQLVLRREVAERGIFPALSVSESLSRLAHDIQSEEERGRAIKLKRLFGRLESDRELALFADRLDPELELALKHEDLLADLIRGRVSSNEVYDTIFNNRG